MNTNVGRLRIGLIGFGRIGERHASVLSNLKIERLELVAICDINSLKLEKAKKIFGLNVYSDYLEMLNKENLDIITICTESGLHAKIFLKCAGKVPNVIIEKPMALKLSDGYEMLKISEKTNSKIFVVKQNRFNFPIQKVREYFESNYFGELFLATARVRWMRDFNYYNSDLWRGSWKLDGGVVANQASHHVDMLQWFMGEVNSVYAIGRKYTAHIEAEDTAVVAMKFKSGALGILEATTATRTEDLEGSLSILGNRGSAVVSGFAMNRLETLVSETLDIKTDLDKFSTNPPDVYGFGHIKFYEHVSQCIIESKHSFLNVEEGLKSLKIIAAIYKSMELNREVYLSEESLNSKLGN